MPQEVLSFQAPSNLLSALSEQKDKNPTISSRVFPHFVSDI
jgi:hypothetical protein